MTPLQRMSAAIDEQITAIYGSPPDRGEGEKIGRAALLALAEAEDLGRSVTVVGVAAGALRLPEDEAKREIAPVRIFRAMLRAIAGEGK